MRKREHKMPLAPVEVTVGSETIHVAAVQADQVRAYTPPGGVNVRGNMLSGADILFLEGSDWKSWSDEKTPLRFKAGYADKYKEASESQSRAVQSLLRQAAAAFAKANPALLAQAEAIQANNDVARADDAYEKAQKAFNEALDAREKALAREGAALEAVAAFEPAAEAPAFR